MKKLSLLLLLTLLAILYPTNATAINFAIDPASPSINGNITPDDVLLPGPAVFIQGRNLGLQDFFFAGFFDDLNALSYGQDPIRNPLFFSVDRVAVGLPGSDVNLLAQPGIADAARHVYVALPPVGTNRLFIHGGQLGLIGGFFGDDLNGLELDTQPRPFIYFSIDVLSATNNFGTAGLADDILVSSGNGSFSILHDGVNDIGLRLGDDIDALVYDAARDIALFSLSPFSPSTFTSTGLGYAPCMPGQLSPADVCITFFNHSYSLWASAGAIGLRPGDNVNALDTVPEPPTIFLLAIGFFTVAVYQHWLRRWRDSSFRERWLKIVGALLLAVASMVNSHAIAANVQVYVGNSPPVGGSNGTLTLNEDPQNKKTFEWRSSDFILGSITSGVVTATKWNFIAGSDTDPARVVFTGSGGGVTFYGDVLLQSYNRGVVDVVSGARRVRYLVQACTVDIVDDSPPIFIDQVPGNNITQKSGKGTTKNVGQEVKLKAQFTGKAPATFEWKVEATTIESYTDIAGYDSGKPDALKFTVQGETANATFNTETIRYFWKDTGDPRKVTVKATAADGAACVGEKNFTVERNTTDVDRQAEDFFTSCCSDSPERVRIEHRKWHTDRERDPATRMLRDPYPGEDFLAFHRVITQVFDDWRQFFGYTKTSEYDGSVAIPAAEGGYTIKDATRTTDSPVCDYPAGAPAGTLCPVPPWFTKAGDGRPLPGADIALQCKDLMGNAVPGGTIKKLTDFKDNRAMGCALNTPYHGRVHVRIGGSMGFVASSPKDPVFWRFHKFLAGVKAASPSIFSDWEDEVALGPPGISLVYPTRGFSYASLPAVVVTFWKPVTGVAPGSLVVNGSSATDVSGSGAGPYTFTGFTAPGFGPVNVVLTSGVIRDSDNRTFAGESWTYVISPDTDGDGIPDDRDNCPTVFNPDQTNTPLDFLLSQEEDPTEVIDVDPRGDACRP